MKWEYLIITIPEWEEAEELDRYGKNGWELIGFFNNKYYFKRMLKV